MFTLIDAELKHLEHPRTFEILPADVREDVQPGQLVKLGFEYPTDTPGERMWVRVTERDEGGYVGVLINDPLFIDDLEWGSQVTFDARHILEVGPQ